MFSEAVSMKRTACDGTGHDSRQFGWQMAAFYAIFYEKLLYDKIYYRNSLQRQHNRDQLPHYQKSDKISTKWIRKTKKNKEINERNKGIKE